MTLVAAPCLSLVQARLGTAVASVDLTPTKFEVWPAGQFFLNGTDAVGSLSPATGTGQVVQLIAVGGNCGVMRTYGDKLYVRCVAAGMGGGAWEGEGRARRQRCMRASCGSAAAVRATDWTRRASATPLCHAAQVHGRTAIIGCGGWPHPRTGCSTAT